MCSLLDQFLSFSCSFGEKIGQIIGRHLKLWCWCPSFEILDLPCNTLICSLRLNKAVGDQPWFPWPLCMPAYRLLAISNGSIFLVLSNSELPDRWGRKFLLKKRYWNNYSDVVKMISPLGFLLHNIQNTQVWRDAQHILSKSFTSTCCSCLLHSEPVLHAAYTRQSHNTHHEYEF